MSDPSVSVVVVSRGRPEFLTRCLTGLTQLYYQNFEVIIVADPTGAEAVRRMSLPVKLAEFDEANISIARNRGIALAAGDLVAFIDDDSVPEPTWLDHLTAPFSNPKVVAAGGYVRARNGIGFQWRANKVDNLGHAFPVSIEGTKPRLLRAKPGFGIKTEGTNSAFRRDVLAQIGGFDPGFRFYLDETDVNLRLSGQVTAIVPLAQVHHGFAPSAFRRADRMPKSLHEVGASSALFLRKHAPDRDPWATLAGLSIHQHKRMVRHMVAGNCEPRDVARLLETLKAGWVEGLARPVVDLPPLSGPVPPFIPLRDGPAPRPVHISGRLWQLRRKRREARALVQGGRNVTLFLFSPTLLHHRLRFLPDEFWEQRGGLLSSTERWEKSSKVIGFHNRVTQEWDRVAKLRHLPKRLTPADDEIPPND